MEITSGKMQKPLKCVVYGPEGIGKSTFASLAPNPLFCDVEDSTAHMDVRRLPRATSYQMILDEIAYVKANPDLCDTFVLDTADWAERICRDNVCAKNGKTGIEDFGYGKGYSYVFEDFGRLLNALDDLLLCGINIIVNAHAVMRKFEQPDEMGAYDRWELKLNNSPKCSVANMLKEWADLVLFANYETIVVKNSETKKNKAQGGQRVMYTTHHPCWDAKNRFGLPDKLPFDFRQVSGLFMRKSAVAPANCANSQTLGNFNASAVTTPPVQESFPLVDDPDEQFPFDVEIPAGTPKALADLMRNNVVSEREITQVVSERGYFPKDMKLCDYPPDFVSGVLIGAWDQVYEMVKTLRKKSKFTEE